VRLDLLRCSEASAFAIFAYCFMPDHVHLLLVAESEGAQLLECVRRFKQVSGFKHRQRTGLVLWQTSFYDRVLRGDEETTSVGRYIWENPVRAGLTEGVRDYPFSGSAMFTREEMDSLWHS
jgi:putative transposase